MTLVELARRLRPYMEKAVQSLDEEEALVAQALHPSWDKLCREGVTVEAGFRFRHGDALYKTLQASYTFVSHYVPGVGTESLFARIDEVHAGSGTDPIPYEGNMELVEGLLYTQDGVIYRCIRSTGQPVYHALSDLVGLYVEVAA